MHKEIIELVEDWENYDKWEKENKEHNQKLREKYNEIEPIIKKVEEAQETLKEADNDLSKIIGDLFKDKIAQAWERTKTGDGYSAEYLAKHPTPDKGCSFYREIAKVEKLKNGDINEKIRTLKVLLKDGYYKRYDDETWLRTTYYGKDKEDGEKKLKTRLAKLGVIEK